MTHTFRIPPRAKKWIAWKLILAMLIQVGLPISGLALSEGPSQPEAMQFEPVDTTDMVNLATGNLAYNLPLIHVPGPGGGFPLSLHYHSDVGTYQEGTWTGLGWNINPGAINRSVVGVPDDYHGARLRSSLKGDILSWGLGVGVSYGPVGMELGYDNNQGFSVNSLSVGYQGVRIGAGLRGKGSASFSAGGVGISTDGTDVTFSMGYSVNGLHALGASISTSGNMGISAGFASTSSNPA
ncbi:MAG: hypothetical protein AAF570_16630, partial [Bacteroidota bacterium]